MKYIFQFTMIFIWNMRLLTRYIPHMLFLEPLRAAHSSTWTTLAETCQATTRLMYQSIPKPPIPLRAIPGHLTRVKFRTVGNLTQNEAHPVGHLTFVSKKSVSGRKQKDFAILWFSRWVAFTDHCSCRFHVGFSFVVVLYSSIVEYAFV